MCTKKAVLWLFSRLFKDPLQGTLQHGKVYVFINDPEDPNKNAKYLGYRVEESNGELLPFHVFERTSDRERGLLETDEVLSQIWAGTLLNNDCSRVTIVYQKPEGTRAEGLLEVGKSYFHWWPDGFIERVKYLGFLNGHHIFGSDYEQPNRIEDDGLPKYIMNGWLYNLDGTMIRS